VKESINFRDAAKAFFQRYRVEFLMAAVLITAFFHAVYTLTRGDIDSFMAGEKAVKGYRVLMVFLSAMIFLIAHISYPKIYKFKMLLTGYALVSVFIGFLIATLPSNFNFFSFNPNMAAIRDSGRFVFKFLFVMLGLNALIIMLVSPTVNFNIGKNSAIALLLANLAVFLLVLAGIADRYVMSDTGRFATKFVTWFVKYHAAINFIFFAVAAVFSAMNIEDEHNYGSIILGISFISLYGTLTLAAGMFYPAKIMLPLLAVLVVVGMLVHWLNCLHHKAHYDPLLKIYNRQYMGNILAGIADIKLGPSYTVLMCDIDHFKKVNDTYGHAAGDEVLFETAQAIRDTALPEGVVCRYGGEEIIVFLRGMDAEDARAKAEKIRKAVKRKTVKFKHKTIKVTLSVGGSECRDGQAGMEKAIKKADDAVYKAKKAGRDRVVIL
jgi:diguanylate cyclase (GGDEF)-like protein